MWAEVERSQSALSRLLDLVAQGLMSPRDPALAEKLAEHKTRVATLSERASLLERQLSKGSTALTSDLIARFGQLVRDKLREHESPQRRNYVRMFVDEVAVSPGSGSTGQPKIILRGQKFTLETAAASAFKEDIVPIFDRKRNGAA